MAGVVLTWGTCCEEQSDARALFSKGIAGKCSGSGLCLLRFIASLALQWHSSVYASINTKWHVYWARAGGFPPESLPPPTLSCTFHHNSYIFTQHPFSLSQNCVHVGGNGHNFCTLKLSLRIRCTFP